MALNQVGLERLNTDTTDKIGIDRNLINNGAMQVAQRGTTSTSTGLQTVDRFKILIANTDNFAFTQKQVTDSPSGFSNSYEIDTTTAESALAADEYVLVRQNLEANTLQSLAFGTSSAKQITLSFYVKAKQTGTYAANIYSDDSTRAYTVNYTINQTATWERKSITFSGDTVGAITNNTGIGFFVNWFLAAGTNYTTSTAHKNQWASFTNASWAHGHAVNVLSSTDNYWKITGVQLEVGSVATDFEHRSFKKDLAICQRYYFRIPYQGIASNGGVYLGSGKETGSTARVCVLFPETMRAVPSCGASNLLADDETSATSANTVDQVLASTTEPDRARIQFTGGSYSSGNSISLATGQATDAYLQGSADL